MGSASAGLEDERPQQDQTGGNAHAADWMMTRDELTYHMGQHGIATNVIEEAIKTPNGLPTSAMSRSLSTLNARLTTPTPMTSGPSLTPARQGFAQYVTDRGLDQETHFARLERRGLPDCG